MKWFLALFIFIKEIEYPTVPKVSKKFKGKKHFIRDWKNAGYDI